jgi:hypothetical protein
MKKSKVLCDVLPQETTPTNTPPAVIGPPESPYKSHLIKNIDFDFERGKSLILLKAEHKQ